MRHSLLLAALAAASLSSAERLEVRFFSAVPFSDGAVFLHSNDPSMADRYFPFSATTVGPNVLEFSTPEPVAPGLYTILGASEGGHVAVALQDSRGALGTDWDAFFGSAYSQPSVYDRLTAGDAADVVPFFDAHLARFGEVYGIPLPLFDFSPGTMVGGVQAVPEPACLVALGLGSLALVRRRQRRAG